MNATRWAARVLVILVLLLSAADVAMGAAVTLSLEEAAIISNPDNYADTRVLLKFEVPSALVGSTIDLAMLHITVRVAALDAEELPFEIFRVTREWTADGVAWDDGWADGQGAWNRSNAALCDIPAGEARPVRIDVTRIVQTWVDGGLENRGLVLVPCVAPAVAVCPELPTAPYIRLLCSARRAMEAGGPTEGH